jgi:hypothetical protein
VNHVTRREFCDAFIKELTPYLKEIGVASSLGALSFGEIFPEAKNVKLDEAEKLVNLNAMAIDERAIQDAFRRSLREKGATNMVERKSESSLEIADLEDFTLKIGGRDVSFTCVVKGYKSINGQRVTFEQIAHQIFKAFDGTFPDYIILALAKPPTDAVISHLVRFGESVGNRNLLVWADPIELCRFLRARGVI